MYTKIKVVEFQLTIENDSKRKTYKSGSEMLNDEIKTSLGKIKPGSKIYFEGIKVEHADSSRSEVIMLEFIVY